MKKKFFSVLLIGTIFLNSTLCAYGTNNKTLDDNKAQFQQIGDDLKELDVKINSLNNEINMVNETVNKNNTKIKSVEDIIKSTERKIEISQKEIKDSEEVLFTRVRELYKNGSLGPVNYLSFIFESEGFGDLIARISAVQKIISTDNKMMDELKKQVDSLNKDINDLSKQKSEIILLNDQIKADLLLLKEKENLLNEEKDLLNQKKNAIASIIEENENKLVKRSIDIINSSNPSIQDLKNSVSNLKGLLPQLSVSSIISKTNSAISKGEALISKLSSSQGSGQTPPPSGSGQTPPPSDGNYKATYTMEATAYYGHGLTAMGTVPVRDPNGLSTVAVDRTVIPLGSKVYIPGYGYAIAADTGGAIKGLKIDLFMNSHEECISFGRRTVTVNLVALPGEW